MIDYATVEEFVKKMFNESSVSDRIHDVGFAYRVNTQPRAYIDSRDLRKMTFGNGPIIIVKDTGIAYGFSSNPLHQLGRDSKSGGVNTATTLEDFNRELEKLKARNDYHALNPIAFLK
ncbi:hypothetical protein ccbrp13_60370 [Ktedonobacteria bacterium brp13]|nr:hypothetical protein ccbrp13_60370 [Ktedonobacteria bacterium brp13]